MGKKMSFAVGQAFILTAGHGYSALVDVLAFPVHIYGSSQVMKARKKFNVSYPTLYLPKGEKGAQEFNCIQRGHQSFLEHVPIHFMLQTIGSLYRPKLAAAFAFIRVSGLFFNIRGYCTGEAKNRSQGRFGLIGMFGLLALALEASVKTIMNGA